MGNLNLTTITDQTPYVQKIKDTLREGIWTIYFPDRSKEGAALYGRVYQLIDYSDLEQA